MSSDELNQLGSDIQYVYKAAAIVGAHILADNLKKRYKQFTPGAQFDRIDLEKLLDIELKKLEGDTIETSQNQS